MVLEVLSFDLRTLYLYVFNVFSNSIASTRASNVLFHSP